jgi:hypothetical protein
MKITKNQLKQIIKEELEVILTNEEVSEMFGDDVLEQLEDGGDKVPVKNPVQTEAMSDEPDMGKVRRLVSDAIYHLEKDSIGWAIRDDPPDLKYISSEINRVLGIMKDLEDKVGKHDPRAANFRE